MILATKFLPHQPLNRQSATCAREGLEIDVSTLADWAELTKGSGGRSLLDWSALGGASVATRDPIVQLIRAHVFGAGRIHADDTTVPGLAKLKTITSRIWTDVRDDRPFAARIRRRRSSPPRAPALANIRAAISLVTVGSCKPTLEPVLGPAKGRTRAPDTTNSMRLDDDPRRSRKRPVGLTEEENSSNSAS